MVGLSKFRLRFGGRWACEKNGNILIGLAKVEFASITCLVRFYFREFQITLTTPITSASLVPDPINFVLEVSPRIPGRRQTFSTIEFFYFRSRNGGGAMDR